MAIHSSILALIIPWMEEPGRLRSMGSQRVRHDYATLLQFTSSISFEGFVCVFVYGLRVQFHSFARRYPVFLTLFV